MKEHEKEAERIIDMFYMADADFEFNDGIMTYKIARKCALIDINETIETLFKLKVLAQDKTLIYKEIGFLKQVKEAIQNK